MISDVFSLEMLRADRRPRYRIAAKGYAAWLLLQFATLYIDYFANSHLRSPVEFVDTYVLLLFRQQLLLILLGVPVFVAGAITEEKSRGTLQDLLTTDLSSASIVIGKILAGIAQAGLVLLMGLPFLCFLGPCAACDAPRLMLVVGHTLTVLFGWSAVSILVSVWARQTRRAILALYLMVAAVFGGSHLLDWVVVNVLPITQAPPGSRMASVKEVLTATHQTLAHLDPEYLFGPAGGMHDSAELGRRLGSLSSWWLALGVVALVLAVWRLRPAYRRQLEAAGRKPGRLARWFRARVTDDPVCWKEQHVEGLAPLRVLRAIPTWVGIVLIVALTLYAMKVSATPRWASMLSAGLLLLSTLAVAVRCSSAVSGERERQTWEAVLLTPLAIRRLIASKLRGVVAATYPYVAAFAIPALGIPAYLGESDLFLVLAVWIFATVVAIQFIGAVGVWCSARMRSSWIALIATLGIGYLGGGLVALFGVPIVTIVLFYIMLFLSPIFIVFNLGMSGSPATMQVILIVSSCVGIAAVFLRLASHFILQAERLVLKERTPFWKSGFNCGYALEQYMQALGETSRELREDEQAPRFDAEPVGEAPLPYAEPVGPR
jgi:ABC-type transport system involved in multi-copper enzyme maturation permease subunit